MKTIGIVTPCYNKEGNVDRLYTRIRAVITTESDRALPGVPR